MSREPNGTVSLEREGRRYTAAWRVHRATLSVELAPFGARSQPWTDAAAAPAPQAARLLAELVDGYLASRRR